MPKEGFLAVLTSLWLRLSTVAIIGLLFFVTLLLPERLVRWSFYLSNAEVVFEMAVFVVFMALAGVALGAIGAVTVLPSLFRRPSSRRRRAEIVTRIAVATAAFIDLGIALRLLLALARMPQIVKAAVYACYFVAFAAVLLIPRRRERLVTSLDGYLGEKATRRAVLGTWVASATLVAAEKVVGTRASAAVTPRRTSRPSGPSVLLITFDALSAEDMSLYGYRLPTTPNIDENSRVRVASSPISTPPRLLPHQALRRFSRDYNLRNITSTTFLAVSAERTP